MAPKLIPGNDIWQMSEIPLQIIICFEDYLRYGRGDCMVGDEWGVEGGGGWWVRNGRGPCFKSSRRLPEVVQKGNSGNLVFDAIFHIVCLSHVVELLNPLICKSGTSQPEFQNSSQNEANHIIKYDMIVMKML